MPKTRWNDPAFMRDYHRKYRRKNLLKIRVRNRVRMRKVRAEERRLEAEYGAVHK